MLEYAHAAHHQAHDQDGLGASCRPLVGTQFGCNTVTSPPSESVERSCQ